MSAAPAVIVATATPVLTAVLAAGTIAAGNGRVAFGFISNTDPGLDRGEFVCIPYGPARAAYTSIGKDVNAPNVADNYLACLLTDAHVVGNMAIADTAKPWIASNRAYAYALGYLTEEVVMHPAALTIAEKNTLVAAHAHVVEAATIRSDVGTLATFITTLGYYQSNHNTFGTKLPGNMVKAIDSAYSKMASLDVITKTKACYLAGHASDKRITLGWTLPTAVAARLVRPTVFLPAVEANMDAWARQRTGESMVPAGTAILQVTMIVIGEVVKNGLHGIAPAPQAIVDLKAGVELYKSNITRYHPGANYLFGLNPLALSDIENLKHHFTTFGSFCMAAGFASSITKAPHYAKMITDNRDSTWWNMGKLFAKGVVASDEMVKAAAKAVGNQMSAAIPDPTKDAPGYAAAVKIIKTDFDSISLN